MSLKLRMAIAVLIPTILAVLFAGSLMWERRAAADSVERLGVLIPLARDLSAFVHELQIERGLSVGLIASGFDPERRPQIERQRAAVDARAGALALDAETAASAGSAERLTEAVRAANARRAELPALRQRVESRSLAPAEAGAAFTAIIESQIGAIRLTETYSPALSISALLRPWIALIEAKEFGGRERAFGSATLVAAAKAAIPPALHRTWLAARESERQMLEQFRGAADEDFRALFAERVSGAEVAQVEAWRKVLETLPETADPRDATGPAWFAATTVRLGRIREV